MSSSHSTPQKRHAASTPSKLSRSTSNTPYHLFSDSPSTSSSPFARRTHASSSSSSSSTSALLTPSKTHIFNASLSTNASPVFRRNVGFGSPGFRASAAPASARRLPAQRGAEPRLTSPHTKGHAGRPIRESSRFVRRKPWLERIQSAPVDLYFAIQSHLSDLEDLFHQPSLGYPIGVSLHLISFLTHLISPDSSLGKNLFGTRRPSSPLSKASRINKGGLPGLGFEKAERLKRLAQSQTTVWLRYVSLLLAILLVLLSCWNAYLLFTSRRQYRLWMRREDEKVASENARLVPALIPDEDRDSPKTTWVEKGVDLALKALSHVPIVGWFVPLPPTKPPNPHQSRMHALNIWQAPEVPLRIFSVYSPAHSIWWLMADHLGIRGPLSWILSLGMMSLFAFQVHHLSQTYKSLVKDRILLSAEVMHEYDEKFVLPRAMPLVRDASTMTSPVEEMIGPNEG